MWRVLVLRRRFALPEVMRAARRNGAVIAQQQLLLSVVSMMTRARSSLAGIVLARPASSVAVAGVTVGLRKATFGAAGRCRLGQPSACFAVQQTLAAEAEGALVATGGVRTTT